ncbi:TetR/AcrR family transcriptional regulator [Vibrio sp. JC009]|uniref:TetR/AcrR family transcriptional regulator n=1 Tax=Vibrio sp. JC009 TaxID=2912314 RepID=UPI0023B1EF55|nr:TetR/AcrR family transcriptional regulator [Vibrio sp. JC009]WED24290.1 TetR/AcrR family transcriptional regulator [Vibrio sp. JC009]
MLKEQIAASLEVAFSKHGFAEPSVARLKDACNVSLRTLYKHYPSKAAMVIGALEHRHQRYLSFLLTGSPEPGIDSVLHIFKQLEFWMKEYAPHGCLSVNAIAAFPDSPEVTMAVKQHKEEVRQLLGRQSQREELSDALFLLHEGVSSAWPVMGQKAVISAQEAIQQIMRINR